VPKFSVGGILLSIAITKPTTNRDVISASFNIVLACVEAGRPTGPNVHNVALRLRDAVKELAGAPSDTVENRAWNWAVKTLAYAVGEILIQARRMAPLSASSQEAIDIFIESSSNFDGVELDSFCFGSPSSTVVFQAAKKALPQLLMAATTGSRLQLDTLDERFDAALRSSSARVVSDDPDYYNPLEAALTSLGGIGARRDADWSRHHFWISKQFTDTIVFSPDESETTPVESVYLRLRCFWNEADEATLENSRQPTEYLKAHVSDIHSTTMEWLMSNDKSDAIRIVTGGPGSGKSSFARSFAHEVMQKGKYRVAFVRLQYARLTGSLLDDIAKYFSTYDSKVTGKGNAGLPRSPIELRKEDDTPLLFIFDGLDELTTNDDASKKYATDFILALSQALVPLNSDGSRICALVLGRNIACEAAMKAANIPLKKMLNVAQIAPLSRAACRLSEHSTNEQEDCFDPHSLMKIDQREEYWRKWAVAKGLPAETVPEPITDNRMEKLNVEPLLLHLLVISKYCGADWELAADNRNLVYMDILQKIYQRNRSKNHDITVDVEESEYFLLLECLGLAAWRGNGRTGDDTIFRTIRKLHINKERKYKDMRSSQLESVALNLHTRGAGRDGGEGYEFIHKSFGEYLAARGLVSHALRMARELEDSEPEDYLRSWVELIGPAELTPEIIRFIFDETKRLAKTGITVADKELFNDFFFVLADEGPPVHQVFPELNWKECEARARCALSAGMALISAISTSLVNISESDIERAQSRFKLPVSKETLGIRNIFERVGVTSERPVQLAMRGVDISRRRVWSVNLSRAQLSNSAFERTSFIRCILIHTNFSYSDMMASEFTLADAPETNFSHCDLRGAIFKEARLKGAVFDGSDLSRHAEFDRHGALIRPIRDKNSIFWGANLELTSFVNVNCNGANFVKANLSHAVFMNTKLSESDFSSAILIECHFVNCDLTDVLGLTNEQAMSAVFDKSTVIPKHIDSSALRYMD
jgi:uncharacterized protein YjbI with pentapeptide repeats